MRKYCLLIIELFFYIASALANDKNVISLSDMSIEDCATEAVLPLLLSNESEITGFQCDLYLPEGISVATDEYGDYVISLSRTTPNRHTVSTSLQPDGALRILCTSMTNAKFSGNVGAIANISLSIGSDVSAGTYTVGLRNIVMSDLDANRHTSPDTQSFLTLEEGKVVVTADNISIEYGDPVPELTYSSDGVLHGTPVLSCTVSSTSPVGTYPISIGEGSVENTNVEFRGGTITVYPAPLTIQAGDYTKREGEENPVFTAQYIGFKNNETEAVLTTPPVFSTEVTASTYPGIYPVKVSGATAENYCINYVDGTIKIIEKVVDETVNVLMLADVSFEEGAAEVVLPLLLSNESEITGFQCDLYLPEGISVATDEYGDYVISLSRTTPNRHTVSTSLQPDGALRILCTSMTNAKFSGNVGAIANISLSIGSDVLAGTYTVGLRNIVMSDPDANRIMSENCEGVINVSKKTNIGNINKNSNKSFEAYTINGRFVGASNSMKTLYHKLDKGLYIIGGKKYIIGVR